MKRYFFIKEFGKEKNHLEILFKNSKNNSIKAIAFFKTTKDLGGDFKIGDKISLLVNFENNTFLGRTELRLRIVDVVGLSTT
jgi:hypothetical protein